MKRLCLIAVTALLAGILAFYFMRSRQLAHHKTMVDSIPELTWVKSEFKLDDKQFAKVAALHAAYQPKCMEMCHRIASSQDKIRKLASGSRTLSSELDAAVSEHAALQLECQKEMLKHLYQTADMLPPDQAGRYLEDMTPYAIKFSHQQLDDHGH